MSALPMCSKRCCASTPREILLFEVWTCATLRTIGKSLPTAFAAMSPAYILSEHVFPSAGGSVWLCMEDNIVKGSYEFDIQELALHLVTIAGSDENARLLFSIRKCELARKAPTA